MVCLPPHQRCAAHTLNLIATTDAARANMDPEYSKASTSVFKKCSAIWNKQGQSVRAADIVKSYCGIYLTRPVATRWNSYHEALECILRLVNEGKDINGLCRALNVPVFQRGDDFKFIEEYCTVSTLSQVFYSLHSNFSRPEISRVRIPLGDEPTVCCTGYSPGGQVHIPRISPSDHNSIDKKTRIRGHEGAQILQAFGDCGP